MNRQEGLDVIAIQRQPRSKPTKRLSAAPAATHRIDAADARPLQAPTPLLRPHPQARAQGTMALTQARTVRATSAVSSLRRMSNVIVKVPIPIDPTVYTPVMWPGSSISSVRLFGRACRRRMILQLASVIGRS